MALPHLFVQAEWSHWGIEKIRHWSSLAGSQPLSVVIEDRGDPSRPRIYIPDNQLICPRWRSITRKTSFAERCCLAADHALNIGKLCLRTRALSFEMVEETICPSLSSFMPKLSTLFLFSGQATEFEFVATKSPNLKTFHFVACRPHQ
ncbi:hypothetical protein DL93DRAFT_2082762 [Clavulina sp. PMI_390]|nr:hypothetical protein DL93DRAFT_2082762 [Clavulina sp. PMI_390]